LTDKIQKPATSSRVSAKGPSITVRLLLSNDERPRPRSTRRTFFSDDSGFCYHPPTMRIPLHLTVAFFISLLLTAPPGAVAASKPAKPVLIVADEIPAMEALGKQLETRIKTPSEIITQDKLPDSLAAYPAVLVYIHKALTEKAENAFLDYADAGGKLIVLHHSISSSKRPNKNKRWMPALGIEVPEGDFDKGGYKYFDDAEWDIVNLAPKDPITTHGITYPLQIERNGKKLPGYHPKPTEIYLNHVLTGPHTILLGLHYVHKDGKVYDQDTVAWYKPFGKGKIYYFMPGHHPADFDDPIYAQMLSNAVAAH
jgi:hypothetical protein